MLAVAAVGVTGIGIALAVAVAVAVGLIAGRRSPVASPVAQVIPVAPAPRGAPPDPPPAMPAKPTMPPASAPPRAHPSPPSAGRARPPSTKTARPGATLPAEELLKRAQEKFDVGETETALALARQAAGAGARAPAHVLMGKVMMSERRFDEAEQEFAEAVRLDPSDARAARLLALVRETRSGGP
jgi:type IV secretory pathway VirB10-like protein